MQYFDCSNDAHVTTAASTAHMPGLSCPKPTCMRGHAVSAGQAMIAARAAVAVAVAVVAGLPGWKHVLGAAAEAAAVSQDAQQPPPARQHHDTASHHTRNSARKHPDANVEAPHAALPRLAT
jgi:hypothetical protein